MSSHHFVKEKQEPALLVYSEESLDQNLLGQLLEWSPYIIVDEHSLYILNHDPIKIDLVIQRDLSDDEIHTWIELQSELKKITLKSDENKLTKVLKLLEKEDHSAISFIGLSNETFSTLKQLNLEMSLINYQVNCKSFFIEKDFVKWKEKGSVFKIEGNIIHTKNLKVNSNNWEVVEDGLVEIHVKEKTIISELIGS